MIDPSQDLPTDVLSDVAGVVEAQVTPLDRLSGGINAGAWRLQLAGGNHAVLKAEPRSRCRPCRSAP